MKKALLGGGTLALVLFAAACEKDRTKPPVVPSTDNMWHVGNAVYTAASTEASIDSFGRFEVTAAVQGVHGVSGITFVFPTPGRPEPGAYLAVNNFSFVGKEVRVYTQDDNGVSVVRYNTTGYDSIRAVVTGNDSNLTIINLPAAWAQNANKSSDSIRISASGIMGRK